MPRCCYVDLQPSLPACRSKNHRHFKGHLRLFLPVPRSESEGNPEETFRLEPFCFQLSSIFTGRDLKEIHSNKALFAPLPPCPLPPIAPSVQSELAPSIFEVEMPAKGEISSLYPRTVCMTISLEEKLHDFATVALPVLSRG